MFHIVFIALLKSMLLNQTQKKKIHKEHKKVFKKFHTPCTTSYPSLASWNDKSEMLVQLIRKIKLRLLSLWE